VKRIPVLRLISKLFSVIVLFSMLLSGFGQSGPSVARASAPVAPPRQGQGPDRERPSKAKHFQELVDLVGLAGRSKEMGPASNLHKLDSRLQDLMITHLQRGVVRRDAERAGIKVADAQKVLVDIYLQGSLDQAQDELEALGMQVVATNEAFGGIVEGYLPVDALLSAAGLDDTKALLVVERPQRGTGSVTSQGDAAHNGPSARTLGVNGAGVVVGIISDSMNQVGGGVAGSQAAGDLPAGVTVLLDDTDPANVEDEGRAMAEIIYDTAPGITSMYFSSGTTGAAAKAASINSLVSSGVDLIADDIGYWGEPFFQDGVVAQAVDSAYAAGVAYFVSAGNEARQSYEQTYRSLGLYWEEDAEDEPHDFDPGTGEDPYQVIATVQSGQCFEAMLQWDDPWGSGTHDLDWYLYNSVSGTELAYSASNNDIGNGGTGIPREDLFWCNDTGATVTIDHEIDWWHEAGYSGPVPTNLKMKYLSDIENGLAFTIAEYDTSSPAILPDAASANGAMTVAAVWYDDVGLNDPAPYSSRGPVTRLFDSSGVRLVSPEVRQKPQVAGADCVITSSTFEGNLPFGGTEFCGTSAAAPSVAGVAALVLDWRPGLTPAQLYAILGNASNTIDCTLAGNPDTDCGYGFLLADEAVSWAATLYPFADVPSPGKEWMEPWVTAFYNQGITTGCGVSPLRYCPENPVTRAAMAVFILRAIEGPTYTPPAASHYFSDMPVAGKEWMEPWVDQYYREGLTTGCGLDPLRYCPENPVTRAAMAVFLLRALEGSSYVPNHTDHYFSDLPVTGKAWMEPFVDEFYERGITTGCGTAPLRYCPENPVTRAAMAVFIDRAFGLYP